MCMKVQTIFTIYNLIDELRVWHNTSHIPVVLGCYTHIKISTKSPCDITNPGTHRYSIKTPLLQKAIHFNGCYYCID